MNRNFQIKRFYSVFIPKQDFKSLISGNKQEFIFQTKIIIPNITVICRSWYGRANQVVYIHLSIYLSQISQLSVDHGMDGPTRQYISIFLSIYPKYHSYLQIMVWSDQPSFYLFVCISIFLYIYAKYHSCMYVDHGI